VLLVGIVAASAWLRVQAAFHDPNFDTHSALGMLKSDPALLYYFLERILESGGGLPADFRADPRVLHPATTDVLALFPLGIEWIVAWCRGLFGADVPLHVVCVRVSAVCASCAALGVYGLALELTRRVRWALLAAALWAGMFANYRTVGFILIAEDCSLPLLALHFYLLARACRLRTRASIAVCALPLIAALCSWHAMGFFVTLEAGALYLAFASSGRTPLRARGAWIALALLMAAALALPILRSTRFASSAALMLALGTWAGTRWAGRLRLGRAGTAGLCALLAGAGVALGACAGSGAAQYSHVWGLVWHKLVHLGVLPADPLELPAEVRLMWQGPFSTADVWGLCLSLGAGLVLAPVFLLRPRAGTRGEDQGDARATLAWLFALSLPTSWLIERTAILPGVLLPVVVVCAAQGSLTRWTRALGPWSATILVGVCVLVQSTWTLERLRHFESPWYRPAQRQAEIRALIEAIPALVPEREAIAADFMNSPAILAHTRRPILLQPKYEDRESRARAIEFFSTFYHGTPEQMRRLLIEKYDCRYVVFDRFTLGLMREALYLGGIRPELARPEPGTCWAVFCSQDEATLSGVPGYELLYRSPASLVLGGRSTDFFRLYRLRP
jgi:hypothetical protein